MKKIVTQCWGLIIVILVWLIFSSPFFLHGKIPFAGDYNVTFFPPWSQYSQFSMPVKNSAMPDVIDQLYPWKKLVITDWKNGQVPLWNPYNFAGTPLWANYQSAPLTPLNILFFFLPFVSAWGLFILLQPLLAGVGMYMFTRRIALSQLASTFSAISFMFCGFLVVWMGYGTLGYAIGILPFILYGLESRYLLLISLGLAFSFVSGHFQMSVYTLLVAFLYLLFRFLPTKNVGIILSGIVALLSGVLLAAPQIFPSISFYGQSLRSTLFQLPEVIPWQYLFTVVAPDFFGNPVTRNDWFGHYAEWSSYIGLLPLVFAFFSLTSLRKNRFVVFFSLLALLAILLAASPVGNILLILHIPVLATSAAGRIIVVASFSLSILAGIGMDSWIASSQKKKILLGIISCVLFVFGWGIIFLKPGLTPQHVVIARQNFLLPSLFLLSSILGAIFAAIVKNKRIIFAICCAFLFITAFDVNRFANKWQNFSPASLVFPSVGVTQFFQSIKNERSLGNYGGQVSLYYQLPSLEGYDALYPERIGEFASFVADGTIRPASRSVVDFPKNGKYTTQALDLLGVQNIIHKVSDTGKVWTYPFWQSPKDFTQVYQDDNYLVLKNTKAYPRAFIVGDFVVKTAKQNILTTLFAPSFNREKTLVMEENPGIAKNTDISGSAQITAYNADKVTIATRSNKTGLLFLSDTYFPGWKAYVDGKETKVFETDYAFRSIVLPAGQHTVIFSYQPESFMWGIITGICSLLLLSFTLFILQKRN